MKRRTWYLLIVMIVLGAFAAKFAPEGRSLHDRSGVEVRGDIPSRPEHQEPIGWVFGRLIGFPGADRPMTSPMFQSNVRPMPTPEPQFERSR